MDLFGEGNLYFGISHLLVSGVGCQVSGKNRFQVSGFRIRKSEGMGHRALRMGFKAKIKSVRFEA